MKRNPDKLVTVAIGEPTAPGEPKTLILGVPKGAWEYMQNGQTHTFDLRSEGIQLQVIMFGADDREGVLALLEQAASVVGGENLTDLGIKEPSVQ